MCLEGYDKEKIVIAVESVLKKKYFLSGSFKQDETDISQEEKKKMPCSVCLLGVPVLVSDCK